VPTLSQDRLVAFARDLFQAGGVAAAEAAIVARSLVDANLAGHDSHGVIRIPQYLKAIEDGHLKTGVPLTVLNQTPAVLACDGNWGLGQVQAHRLLQKLEPMAKAAGVAAGTLCQRGHIGRLGEYAEAATAHGFAFLASVNNHGFGRAVAPPGGVEGRIGTNPLCMAVPLTPTPLPKSGERGRGEGTNEAVVLDIGTSVCAEGKLRVAFNKGEPVPHGWIIDAEGKPTTDPGTFYRSPYGTILPLGGNQAYKGFGIGLLLDMLVGGLSGAPCSRPEAPPRTANAVLFMLFDSEHFAGVEHFRKEVHDLAANVRASKPMAGATVTLPGDPERRERTRRSAEGIKLDDGTWGQLAALANELKVTMPS
jgi:hydroxycarboxylate dehydrogenase B